jgi:hypothetical protein
MLRQYINFLKSHNAFQNMRAILFNLLRSIGSNTPLLAAGQFIFSECLNEDDIYVFYRSIPFFKPIINLK